MFWSGQIPQLVEQDEQGRRTEITIIAGQYKALRPPSPPPNSWAAKPESDLGIWSANLDTGAEWKIPAAQTGTQRSLYVVSGGPVLIEGQTVRARQKVLLRPEFEVRITAQETETRLLLLQGRPIGEPVAQHGPFVMNTRDEIVQAYADYRRTQFGGWPWQSTDPVHGGSKGRFARHADGRVEKPS